MTTADTMVLVVDDDASIRESLRSLIRLAGMRCETFPSANAMLAYARPDLPTCLVLDVQLPGLNGLDLSAELARAGVDMPIVFITGHGTIPMSVRAIKGGAVEFLTKPFSDTALLDAIHQALERDRAARARREEQRSLLARYELLTPRERDVFSLVASGHMNKQIAAQLGIVEQTIKQHRGRVMHKLGARSVADLVRFAERLSAMAER